MSRTFLDQRRISYLPKLASLVTASVVAIVGSFPGMWGVLAFIGNFIPYVGSLVALVLPVLLAFDLEPPAAARGPGPVGAGRSS